MPPFPGLLKEQVRCIRIGTHVAENQEMLRDLFVRADWEIVFNDGPNGVTTAKSISLK
jgi:hypothetical protein